LKNRVRTGAKAISKRVHTAVADDAY